MISMDLPVTKFINSIVNGLVSYDEKECIRHEKVYEDAFRLGYGNRGNENFIACLLDFWQDYVKFMKETDAIAVDCDVESCEICSTEDICDEGCDCHSDNEPEREDNEEEE